MRHLSKVRRPHPFQFSSWMDDFLLNTPTKGSCHWNAAVNVKELENGFELQLAAPGFQKDQFNIDLKGQVLSISAAVEQTDEVQAERFTRKEFSVKNFTRSFTLPKSIDTEAIEANYVDGILFVTLPKLESATPAERSITIA